MMLHQPSAWARLAAFSLCVCLPAAASAAAVTGSVEPITPTGQYIALAMTINDATTTFEITGPDFSFFAIGFDTTTMMGYSLIIQGTDGNRTAVEQNLVGIGNPGGPQATQNINLISTVHDAANDLTTVMLERLNQTGDPNDPVFTTNMAALNIIWAFDSFATPASPSPDLTYHGSEGRGVASIAFAPVPEPAAATLVAVAAAATLCVARQRRRRSSIAYRRPLMTLSPSREQFNRHSAD